MEMKEGWIYKQAVLTSGAEPTTYYATVVGGNWRSRLMGSYEGGRELEI
jgi:hypothetical protein